MRRTLATVAVAVLAGTTLLSGCSDHNTKKAVDEARSNVSSAASQLKNINLPNVDWSKYGDQAKKQIDHWASTADCSALRDKLGHTAANDSDLTRYIKAKIRQAC